MKSTQPNVLIAVAAFSCLVVTLLQSLVVPAIPRFPEMLGTSATTVSWLVTATLLVGASATPIVGRLADLYSPKRLLIITMGLVFVGSVIAPIGGVPTLIFGRALQGLGTAIVPVAMAQMRLSLPGPKIPGALALLSATLGIGGGLGIPIGGVLMAVFGWKSMFVVAALLSGLATVALWLAVPQSTEPKPDANFDYRGATLLSAGLTAVLVVLSQGSSWGWGHPLVLGLSVAGVLLFLWWGRTELRSASPLVDLQTVRIRPILFTNIASVLLGTLMFTNLLLTTLELQNPVDERGFAWGASAAGLAMLPSAAAMFVVAPLSTGLARKIGPVRLLSVGALVTLLGYLMRVAVYISPAWVILAATVVAVGVGISYAAMPMVIVQFAPREEAGSAQAVNALMRAIGMALSSAIVAAVTTTVAAEIITLGSMGIVMSVVAAALAWAGQVREQQ
ncbi:MFS transporter [Corynebacterium sp. 153RC1]|uniref:MFS transporter n=1 Tax=unclassified Corynebacterium TaxID=2624378 RepID=UPI00211C0A73|nr:MULTISPECIES: MFS transporter [unclassified Corynebacterium]MCQ9351709.1 MFS transporter [Corynebacterium sp. 209RC1]MCQ9354078.1 MFS transporter [Corynebacterium sp. 1222RC1]MCQ9355991.1 MFS transporter [Corynebacterium sp. 122RC1]MCQ9358235.1 MFS transporter [Corynebacterium sp. 142RC1]MCQ9360161.1 MFS transporter [Corynebacterium sp. 153RC1]